MSASLEKGARMKGVVEGIFVTGEGSAAMERVEEVRTVEGCGIEGDRYCEGTGFWTRYGDVCQVTLIEGEDLDYIQDELGIGVEERRAPAQHHHPRHKAPRPAQEDVPHRGGGPRVRPAASALQARTGNLKLKPGMHGPSGTGAASAPGSSEL